MRAVVQRANSGSVEVGGEEISSVGKGLVVLLGVAEGDEEKDCKYIADKLVNLRIFPDESGKMTLSLSDIGGEILIVSQFTLMGDARKGRRPDFFAAAPPAKAEELYEAVASQVEEKGITVGMGLFGAYMSVRIDNDGPVTILLDSKRDF